MRTLCFATNNAHKLKEIQNILGDQVKLVTLEEIGCFEEIDEPFDTIAANSEVKARFIWERFKVNNFADDSGLVIPALDGEPGVRSARYAGPERDNKANIRLVWERLRGLDTSAYFVTVITLIMDGGTYVFEGKAQGRILFGERGENGFGYDPVFLPEGSDRTFAEMSLDEKSKISHRAKAFNKLKAFLQGRY
ncbi:MAG: non-canonical purine NTP pyrophosphatase, RdgB/HAM1 family [Cytophagaceae bacterium SCN 52-12]|nr:MAG: non-canonical purine NTP pyrophosphatase, RdgB/HAM1 family [Cytophagaceae bacterium SCN 52-12]